MLMFVAEIQSIVEGKLKDLAERMIRVIKGNLSFQSPKSESRA